MRLKHIECFVAVCKYMNFTKAAYELYTTQPTVSKYISSLENELGLILFDRSGKNIKLTPSGEILLVEFKKTLESIDKAVFMAKQVSDGTRGHLNIGYPPSLNVTNLMPNLFKYMFSKYPDLRIELFTYDFKQLRERLIKDELDIVFTASFEEFNCKDLISRFSISKTNPKIYYNKEYFNTDEITVDDFKDIPIVILRDKDDENTPGNRHVKTVANNFRLKTNGYIYANTLEAMFFYVESGEGIAILGSSYQITENDKISCFELEDKPENKVGTDICWKPNTINHSVDIFISFAKKHFEYQE